MGNRERKLARCVYVEYTNTQGHKGLVVEDCGFIVGQQEGYLGPRLLRSQSFFNSSASMRWPIILLYIGKQQCCNQHTTIIA